MASPTPRLPLVQHTLVMTNRIGSYPVNNVRICRHVRAHAIQREPLVSPATITFANPTLIWETGKVAG